MGEGLDRAGHCRNQGCGEPEGSAPGEQAVDAPRLTVLISTAGRAPPRLLDSISQLHVVRGRGDLRDRRGLS
jgi:hypothetical protein